MGKPPCGVKERLQVLPLWRLLAWRSYRQANEKQGFLCAWVGVHISLVWLVLNWKQGSQLRKLSVTNPSHLGPIITEVIVQFSGLSLEKAFCHSASLTYSSLASGWFIVGKGLASLL